MLTCKQQIIMKTRNILLGAVLALSLNACYDLDKKPQGVLSTAEPFRSTGEIRNYIDRFYESGLRTQGFMAGGGGGIAGEDTNSDNLSSNAANTRLMGHSALSDASALSNYTHIRNVNYLLNNADQCSEAGTSTYNQLMGEGYFFRAWYYYQMFISYGRLAWVDKPLDPNMSEMMLPRESRTFIADKILGDLDTAISLLNEQSNSSTMRVHKDVARALKSEVALFEATWEKYHLEKEKSKTEKFYDSTISETELNNKISSYLTQAIEAAKAVCDRNVWKIYSTGNPLNDYRVIFETEDLTSNSEILWFKRYDGNQVGNSVTRYLNTGGGNIGVTASLVDDYLTIDGKPFVGTTRTDAKRNYPEELQPTVRDPRLSQTVAVPGQRMQPVSAGSPYTLTWPSLFGDGSAFGTNVTGYVMLKHVQIDYTGDYISEYKGSTPAIQFRYADVLLNYAEALAEQNGASNASKIQEVLKPLRDRVGMPGVDFDREYNTEADYPFRGLDKYIQAVRRERRVETALEGRRLTDILRWAAADELILGKHPQGALFTGSTLADKYDGKVPATLDSEGYILPVPTSLMPNGWQFKTNRDYLLPIQDKLISLMDGLWEQNPGW